MTNKKNRSNLLTRLSIAFLSIVCLILVAIAAVPMALSTAWGKEKAVAFINQRIPGSLQVSSLELSWFGGQTIKGLSFASSDGTVAIQCEQWHSEASFLSFLRSGLNIPKSVFTHLTGKVIGEAFSFDQLQLQMHYASPSFAIDLLHDQFHVKGSASFTEGGLVLSEPLIAEWQVTPEMSKRLFSRINPIFADALTSQGPVKLVVEAEGAFLPLEPFDFNRVRIPKATFFASSMQFKNSEYWRLLLQSMQSKALLKLPQIIIQFSPLQFHIADGIASFEKMDALIENTIAIVVWGQVDLNKDQVKMVLGIPAATLAKALGMKDLPSDYLLQIPIKGPTQKLTIDWTKAAADIAKLLVQQKLRAFR
jgi:hypothetical protein